MMEGSETANATAQIPMATMTPPRKATLRNVNLFIIGPLIRPRLLVIVPFKWTISDVCVAVISSEKKRSLKIRPKLCCIGSIASCNVVIFHRSLKVYLRLPSVKSKISGHLKLGWYYNCNNITIVYINNFYNGMMFAVRIRVTKSSVNKCERIW